MKKKPSRVKTVTSKKDETSPDNAAVNDEEIVNPGDCIGHWLDGDNACMMCEIQDSCASMTQTIEKSMKEIFHGNSK